jgi:hypothetical protein
MGAFFDSLRRFENSQRGRPSPRSEYASNLRSAIPEASTLSRNINEAGPESFGGFIEPLLQQGLQSGIGDDNTALQFQQGQQQLGAGLNSALSRANVGSARRGSFDPSAGATQAATGQFGNSLAQLIGQREKQRADQISTTTGQLAGLAGIPAAQSRAEQEGFGSILGTMAGQRQTAPTSISGTRSLLNIGRPIQRG